MAQESDAVRVAREYREQLARNEDAALRRMSRYWMKMEKSLEPRFVALSQEIKDLQDNGQPVPPQLVYTQQRYLDMMSQIMEELPDYEKYAVDIITEYQIENFNLGLDDASAVIRATSPADLVWNQVGKDAVETMAGFAGNGAPLAELMRHDYGDLGVKVTDALVQGIGLGKGAYAVAKDMRDAMGMEFNRSVRIARTEINRAYRIANAEQYAKSGVVTKVLRLCYAPTACLACLELDGEECPKGMCDDHPNGKCTTVAVTIGGHYPQWQHGHDWLMEQSEVDQRRIIGDGRYEMWKNDGIPLRDMVEMKPNAVWGGSPTILSEKALREKYNITGGNRMLFDVKSALAPEPLKPAPRVFEFTPANNIADAEKYISQFVDNNIWGALGVSYKGVSVDVANEINRTIGKFYNDFDVDKFGGVSAPAKNTKLGKLMTEATAAWMDVRRSLLLNRESLKDMKTAEKMFMEESRVVKNILEHPERYDLSRLSRRVLKVIENSKESGRGTVPETIEEAINHELGHSLEKKIKKNPLWEQAKANKDKFGQSISGYACENDSEYIAESFASYRKGENVIDPIMRQIFEGMRK